jgi:phosphoenolpyruvate-protein kinase (PTS system EI component)
MGVIKSAFEIAMENSKGIEANKELVESNRFRDEGKKLVSKLLEDASFNLKESLKGYEKRQGAWVREGLIQSLLANLVLPVDEFATRNPKRIGEAVTAMVADSKKITMIFGQLDNFFKEYVSERKRVVEAIERQYTPKLKKKEEELSRQLGRPVKINPAADPEYQSMVRQYLSQLDAKYNEVLEGAKEEIRIIFSKSPT